ncbi:MAG: ATP-dependent DNA helicase RecG [Patescibacteria group bacterium]
MISPATPIASVPRIHRRVLPALRRLGIETVGDLLLYFPARYEDFSAQKHIGDLALGETATIQGVVRRVTQARTARRHMHLLEAVVEDESGRIKALWFNQPFLARAIKEGGAVRLSGKVAQGPKGLYLQNPAYERIVKHSMSDTISNLQPPTSAGVHTGGLIPVYPETQGITSRWLRFLIKSFLPLRTSLQDPLPVATRERHRLPPIAEAVAAIHFPQTRAEAAAAERRFIFQDLLLFQLRSLRERSRLRQHAAGVIPAHVGLIKEFVASLPFPLTDAQRRSLWEIAKDMEKPRPMHRLLEGDVGSGKTVVAAAAALLAVRAGYRAAFMAPTEILARQHLATLEKTLMPFNIGIDLRIAGRTKKKSGPVKSDITVGTHALIQKSVQFERLGLVVVDEQHRFGVSQRAALAAPSSKFQVPSSQKVLPHFLSMTATPIPRTLALTVYGDLDLSVLDEMPKSRRPVVTKIISPEKRNDAYQFIRSEVRKGRQAFVVCPRIEVGSRKSEVGGGISRHSTQQKLLLAEVKTVKEEFRKLSEEIFPDLSVAMLHGKMKPKEKEGIMAAFREKKYDLLVSTSVIEVGVDVPNATIMMIEGAERFGLAQLHQFRGRVGRGAEQSYCFLFATEGGLASRRLRAVVDAKNGFELAEQDLQIRGPGALFGVVQSGIGDLALKGIMDPILVRSVRDEAVALIQESPDLSRFPALGASLQKMEATLHLE